MKVSTGKVAFPIEFDNGEKAFIYFNPNDRGIQERIKNFVNAVEKRLKEINFEKYRSRIENGTEVAIDFNNLGELLELSTEELKALQDRLGVADEIDAELNEAVKQELNTVFNSDISSVVFRHCQPLDTIFVLDENGNEKAELYVFHFLSWLMTELTKHKEKSKSALDKHLGKYKK